MPNSPNWSISCEEMICPAVEMASITLAPTRKVHQLLDATIAMPSTPTRYTYHGAPRNRRSVFFASRNASSRINAIPWTKKQMANNE